MRTTSTLQAQSHIIFEQIVSPQGTKLGPILLLVMVNDLRVNSPDSIMWKFVGDVSEHLTSNALLLVQ
jgi:hypothetical protein